METDLEDPGAAEVIEEAVYNGVAGAGVTAPRMRGSLTLEVLESRFIIRKDEARAT